MKKMLSFLVMLVLLLAALSAAAEGTADTHRVLVAYLSRAGENYNVGVPR